MVRYLSWKRTVVAANGFREGELASDLEDSRPPVGDPVFPPCSAPWSTCRWFGRVGSSLMPCCIGFEKTTCWMVERYFPFLCCWRRWASLLNPWYCQTGLEAAVATVTFHIVTCDFQSSEFMSFHFIICLLDFFFCRRLLMNAVPESTAWHQKQVRQCLAGRLSPTQFHAIINATTSQLFRMNMNMFSYSHVSLIVPAQLSTLSPTRMIP